MTPRPVAVALFGTFDVDNFGDHLFPRIARRELAARIPGVRLDAFSPFGRRHPTRLDDPSEPAVEPLGERTPARLDEVADAYDAVVVGGGELLHLDDALLANFYAADPAEVARVQPSGWFLEGLGRRRERRCPVLWHGLGVPFDLDEQRAARVRHAVSHRRELRVRDPHSAARLRAAGVTSAITVVPDSGVLVDRLFPATELRRRIDALRSAGAFPVGPALVLQGCDLLVPSAPAMAEALRPVLADGEVEAVLLETGRCRRDGDFADALAGALGLRERVRRVPPDATVADIVAVVAHSAAVVASSLHASLTAAVFGRPFVVVNLGREAKLDGFGVQAGYGHHVIDRVERLGAALGEVRAARPADLRVRALQAASDRHFDDLAESILRSRATGPRRRMRRARPICVRRRSE